MHRLILVSCLVVVGCGGSPDATAPATSAATSVAITLSGVRALDPATEGTFEAWSVANGTARSLGRFNGPSATLALPSPINDGSEIQITVERPGDNDATPSAQVLLRGPVRNGRADLSVVGAVTAAPLTLREHPGQFTMFSPSDNALQGYPSHEESGVWLFNMSPAATEQRDMWVRLSQLSEGWTYEGWMVRDIGQPSEIWLSYGKFLPDYTGALNSRDDSGWGPFSGVVNFRTDAEEEFPGDDWISNPLNLPFPKELTLPLNLRERNAAGQLRWTHVISIEPKWNAGETIGSERPFIIQPYRDSFGDGAPGIARTITFHSDGVPSGRAELR